MLTSNRAAPLQTKFRNGGAEFFGALDFFPLVGIEHDQGMQVAIAGMKHVGTAQAELIFHFFYGSKHPAKMPAWNGAVHAVVVGRDSAGRREGIFTACPENQTPLFGS